jgi:hypothetical protein
MSKQTSETKKAITAAARQLQTAVVNNKNPIFDSTHIEFSNRQKSGLDICVTFFFEPKTGKQNCATWVYDFYPVDEIERRVAAIKKILKSKNIDEFEKAYQELKTTRLGVAA